MRGLRHPLVQRTSYTTWIGLSMGVELAGLLGRHPQPQDRKLALGVGPGAGSWEAVTAVPYVLAPGSALKSGAELEVHLAGGAEFSQPLGDAS
jgi:hypothetical protein